VVAWLVNTGASAVIGLVVGAIVLAIVSVLPFGKKAAH
jgi:predicted DNA repair protein MutK